MFLYNMHYLVSKRSILITTFLSTFLFFHLITTANGYSSGYYARRSNNYLANDRYRYFGESDFSNDELSVDVYPSNQLRVDVGRDAVLQCRATGDPSARVVWSRVGGPLPPTATDQDGYFQIRNIQPQDQGTYVCTATGGFQSKEAQVHITVEGDHYDPSSYHAAPSHDVPSYPAHHQPPSHPTHHQPPIHVSYTPPPGPPPYDPYRHGHDPYTPAPHYPPYQDPHQQHRAQPPQSNGFGGRCGQGEATCQNGECVKRENLCDGDYDCRDRSDESSCGPSRKCEPNEFLCDSGRCVQKMWVCDSEDDCGDRSDEKNCGVKAPGEACSPWEFKCQTRDQCIPKSYHCDTQNDCQDGSDEVGCVPPTVVEPPVPQLQVCRGETIRLTCRGVGGPVPHINWRLNWGPVCEPPRCTQTSDNGFGTLTITNANEQDQGAYTCEAVNVRGRVLATPDAIVTVTQCPPQLTQCNSDGTLAEDRGTCRCKTYAVGPTCERCAEHSFYLAPTNPQGCIRCFCMGITKSCQSSSYFRTQERLLFSYDNQGVTVSDMHERNVQTPQADLNRIRGYFTADLPARGETLYWRLPERITGNKLTAYGGKLKFLFQYSGHGSPVTDPLVVLKGNEITLVYHGPQQFEPDRPNEVVIDMYETSWNREDGREATREHFLMTLAGLDAFLIRQTHTQGQTSSSLGEVVLDIAVPTDTQQLQAYAVEQCHCLEGYQGLSCEECAPGYERSGGGLYLGTCIRSERPPAPACSADGAASQQMDSQGRCQCKEHVTGPTCNQCKPHTFFLSSLNPYGCLTCFCSGVTRECDSTNYFRTQERLSFERGLETELSLRTSELQGHFTSRARPLVDGQRQLSISDFSDVPHGSALYLELPRQFLGNKITSYGGNLKAVFRCSGDGREDQGPAAVIRGNDINLSYKDGQQNIRSGADTTIILSFYENHWEREDGLESTREHLLMTLADLNTVLLKVTCFERTTQFSLIELTMDYAVPQQIGYDRAFAVEQCNCPPGYLGTSCEDCAQGYTRTGGGLYLGLCERCQCHGHSDKCDAEFGDCIDCQHNTEGNHCQLCQSGYTGDATRGTPADCIPAGSRCPQCQCYNHSPRGCDDDCRCIRCEHNTEGNDCGKCKAGFYGDAREGTPFDCKPCPCPGARECYLDQNGQVVCVQCPAGYTGPLCKDCAEGYTPDPYVPGKCSPLGRVIDGRERIYGDLSVLVEPDRQEVDEGSSASFRCTSNNPQARLTWYGPNRSGLPQNAYDRSGILTIQRVTENDENNYECHAIFPSGETAVGYGTLEVRRQEPFRVKILDPKYVQPEENHVVTMRCVAEGAREPVNLKWSKLGGSLPPEVYENSGILTIYNIRPEDSGNYACTGTAPSGQTAQDEATVAVRHGGAPLVEHTPGESFRVQVLEKNVEAEEDQTVNLRCEAVNKHEYSPRLSWSRPGYPELPEGHRESNGFLALHNVKREDSGPYQCIGRIPGEEAVDDANVFVKPKPLPSVPFQVQIRDPKQLNVNEGATAVFQCEVVGQYTRPYQLTWSRPGHPALPGDSRVRDDGLLTIYNVKQADSGTYVCAGTSDHETSSDEATLDAKPAGLSPFPVITPKIQTVKPGDPAEFMCDSQGDPPPIITWGFRSPASPLRAGIEQEDGKLRLSSAQVTDAGEYYCTASNVHGTVSEPATLHVDSGPTPPTVRIEPTNSVNLKPGEDFEFICIATGNPAPQIVWAEEERASLDSNVHDDGQGKLDIRNAENKNSGNYVCTASNTAGEAKDTAVVTIGGGDLSVYIKPVGEVVVKDGVAEVPPDEDIKFECVATASPGLPEPVVEWIYDIGPSRGDVPDGFTPVETHGRFITHDAVTEHNEGKYTCKASSGDITKEVSIQINVTPREKRDVFIVGASERPVSVGDKLTLKCVLNDPKPEQVLRWIRIDGALPPAADTSSLGNLLINGFQPDYAGVYECQHIDRRTSHIIGSSHVKVVVHDSAGVPNNGQPLNYVTVDGPSIQVVEIGESLSLRCTVAVPGSELKWFHLDKEGTERLARGESWRGVLNIRHAEESDGGVYVCVQYLNGFRQGENQVTVIVSYAEKDAIRKRVKVGSSIEIICPVLSVTGTSFHWDRLRSPMPDRFSTDGNILRVNNFQPEDAGVYECEATVNNFNALGYVNLVFEDSSRLIQVMLDVTPDYVTLGSDVTFRCIVDGDDRATVRWERGGADLPSNSQIIGNSLTIRNVNKEDTGVYRCVADTKGGQMATDAVLQIGTKIRTNILRRYFRVRRRYVNRH